MDRYFCVTVDQIMVLSLAKLLLFSLLLSQYSQQLAILFGFYLNGYPFQGRTIESCHIHLIFLHDQLDLLSIYLKRVRHTSRSLSTAVSTKSSDLHYITITSATSTMSFAQTFHFIVVLLMAFCLAVTSQNFSAPNMQPARPISTVSDAAKYAVPGLGENSGL